MLTVYLRRTYVNSVFRGLLSVLLVMLGVGLVVSPAVAQQQPQPLQNDSTAAQEIIRTINQWRIDQGLWPLRENATLDRMAFDQASYVLSLPKTPEEGDIHKGKFGEMPPARAELPQYNWPPYGNAQNTAVGEIAYTGYNAVAAQSWWDSSPIHKRTALNPAYREIGAAAIPQHWGHFYLVDFGSRPDVLPALVNTTSHTLYLSNERYTWARSPFIGNVLKVRLFDADGKPLDKDWETWQSQMSLPANVGDSIYVEYIDQSGVVVLAPVSLDGSDAALPSQPVTPTSTATATATPTATPTNTATPNPTSAASTRAANASPTPTPTRVVGAAATTVATTVATATAPPTATTSASGGSPSVLLLYDARSFTLINSTKSPINMSGLVFVGQQTTFVAARWSNQWLSGTLTSLAGNDCLEVYSWLEKTQLPKPTQCRQRRGVLTIAPEQLFWKQGDFQVKWGDNVLTTCSNSETQCAVILPAP